MCTGDCRLAVCVSDQPTHLLYLLEEVVGALQVGLAAALPDGGVERAVVGPRQADAREQV